MILPEQLGSKSDGQAVHNNQSRYI